MKRAVLRLVLAIVLFAAWIGWLAHLALTASRPIVLSRPQFLVSNLDVIAQLTSPDAAEVPVQGVHWPPAAKARFEGKKLRIANLAECAGWAGPGPYILALTGSGENFRVAPTPPSPGYSGLGQPRIYPLTPETEQQLDAIHKPPDLAAPKG